MFRGRLEPAVGTGADLLVDTCDSLRVLSAYIMFQGSAAVGSSSCWCRRAIITYSSSLMCTVPNSADILSPEDVDQLQVWRNLGADKGVEPWQQDRTRLGRQARISGLQLTASGKVPSVRVRH